MPEKFRPTMDPQPRPGDYPPVREPARPLPRPGEDIRMVAKKRFSREAVKVEFKKAA